MKKFVSNLIEIRISRNLASADPGMMINLIFCGKGHLLPSKIPILRLTSSLFAKNSTYRYIFLNCGTLVPTTRQSSAAGLHLGLKSPFSLHLLVLSFFSVLILTVSVFLHETSLLLLSSSRAVSGPSSSTASRCQGRIWFFFAVLLVFSRPFWGAGCGRGGPGLRGSRSGKVPSDDGGLGSSAGWKSSLMHICSSP